MPTLKAIAEEPQVNVHCIVHPWFDHGEHPEFEANVHLYIDFIARETNDILLIATDGERFDLEQLREFALLDIIEAVSLYLSLNDGGIWDMIDIYDEQWRFSRAIIHNGLTEEFYLWCKENIDMRELSEIAEKWRKLKKDYFAKKYHSNMSEHDTLATKLRADEETARMKLNIEAIARQALEDFWPVVRRKMTYRNIWNPWRFFRIYQHAMDAFWPERMREIFIRDAEEATHLAIQPVVAYQDIEWNMFPTGIGIPESDEFTPQVFNISEAYPYWNAAKLKDDITTRLSVSRFEKLERQQPKRVLADMWVEVSKDTRFLFLWEYRDRCVNNAMHVLNYRMSPLTWDKFQVVWDSFTLERPADHVGTNWF